MRCHHNQVTAELLSSSKDGLVGMITLAIFPVQLNNRAQTIAGLGLGNYTLQIILCLLSNQLMGLLKTVRAKHGAVDKGGQRTKGEARSRWQCIKHRNSGSELLSQHHCHTKCTLREDAPIHWNEQMLHH